MCIESNFNISVNESLQEAMELACKMMGIRILEKKQDGVKFIYGLYVMNEQGPVEETIFYLGSLVEELFKENKNE